MPVVTMPDKNVKNLLNGFLFTFSSSKSKACSQDYFSLVMKCFVLGNQSWIAPLRHLATPKWSSPSE